ncbi:hypothetical protein [Persephonella sp.]
MNAEEIIKRYNRLTGNIQDNLFDLIVSEVKFPIIVDRSLEECCPLLVEDVLELMGSPASCTDKIWIEPHWGTKEFVANYTEQGRMYGYKRKIRIEPTTLLKILDKLSDCIEEYYFEGR